MKVAICILLVVVVSLVLMSLIEWKVEMDRITFECYHKRYFKGLANEKYGCSGNDSKCCKHCYWKKLHERTTK